MDDRSAWNEQTIDMQKRHDAELASLRKLIEEKQKAHEEHKLTLQNMKAAMPTDTYEKVGLPVVNERLELKMRELEKSHDQRINKIRRAHKEERARHGAARNQVLKSTNKPQAAAPYTPANTTESPDPNDNGVSAWDRPETQDSNRLLIPTESSPSIERHGIDDREKRLIPDKRKTPGADEVVPKRSRLDTPVGTPLNKTSQIPERTISFDEVYQNGKAERIDTIIEWPPHKNKWYILKCEQHHLRFTDRPIQGAAKHLNGRSHGLPDRNWGKAIEMLGYLVIGCTRDLAEVNNQAALLTYPKKPDKPRTQSQTKKQVGKDLDSGKNPSPSPRTDLLIPTRKTAAELKHKTPKGKEMREQDLGKPPTIHKTGLSTPAQNKTDAPAMLEQQTPNGDRKSADLGSPSPSRRITHPKTFHVYHGRWSDNLIYPVMVLSWDSQEAGGLNLRLVDTKLLKSNSEPPECYIYGHDMIVGWAPGYEDGGTRVHRRKFPVMFFDECQSVGWISARCLSKFPLYDKEVPENDDHPFNAARNWIARREGFPTWEAREAALHGKGLGQYTSEGQAPTVSSTAPLNGLPAPDSLTENNELDIDSEQQSDAESSSSTDKMVQEWRKNEGEIPGDEDFVGSEPDNIGDAELVDDWDEPLSARLRPDGSRERPWEFYNLRSIENDFKAADSTPVTHDVAVSASTSAGMESSRRLSWQAILPAGASLSMAGTPPTTTHPSGRGRAASLPSLRPEQPCTAASSVPISEKQSEKTTKPSKRARVESEQEASLGSEAVRNKKVSTGADRHALGENKDRGRDDYGEPESEQPGLIDVGDIGVRTTDRELNPRPFASGPIIPPICHDFPSEVAFELTLYRCGTTEWKAAVVTEEDPEEFLNLYYGPENRTLGTRPGASVEVSIDPTTVNGFSRQGIEGTGAGPNAVTLVFTDPARDKVQLYFERNRENTLLSGRAQARGFICWLKRVKPEIQCVDS
ncbi:hypothetical protein F4779DRAFT_587397 [Xylariaceae sp. FL0662B]|nr:hypothetical protein F4779DRAFT_587397 [Xylariaceae sp. FL0662B]